MALGFATERLQIRTFTDRFCPGDLVVVIPGGKKQRPYLAEFCGYGAARGATQALTLRRFHEEAVCAWWRMGGVRVVRHNAKEKLFKNRLRTIDFASPTSFISALVGPDEAAWIRGQALVGFLGDDEDLSPELTEQRFRCDGAEGTLSEALILTGNTALASPRSTLSVDELAEWGPELVVFDGASAFRKWRHQLGGAHHVVVTDRSAPAWDSDFEIIRDAFALRKGELDGTVWPSGEGTGLDVVVFAR